MFLQKKKRNKFDHLISARIMLTSGSVLAVVDSRLSLQLLQSMICPECGDEFTYKSELTLHMQQHKIDLQAHMEERSES